MFLGMRQLLRWVTNSPSFEKSLSEGTDVAGMHKKCFALSDNCGSIDAYSFHQARGSACLRIGGSSLNLFSSNFGLMVDSEVALSWLLILRSRAAHSPHAGVSSVVERRSSDADGDAVLVCGTRILCISISSSFCGISSVWNANFLNLGSKNVDTVTANCSSRDGKWRFIWLKSSVLSRLLSAILQKWWRE